MTKTTDNEHNRMGYLYFLSEEFWGIAMKRTKSTGNYFGQSFLFGAAFKTLLIVLVFALGYMQFERYFKNILIRNARAEVSQQLNGMVKRTESLLNQRLMALTAMRAIAETDRNRGNRYDPAVVDACLGLFQKQRYRFPEDGWDSLAAGLHSSFEKNQGIKTSKGAL
mgnify:CR=1 FL=1